MSIALSHLRHRLPGRGSPRRSAFTIVEMLVVVAIIIVLLTILIVALSQASRAAQRANTTFLMSSVTKGVAAFKGDFGFAPPVLGRRNPDGSLVAGEERTAVNAPDPGLADYASQLQEWHSTTSLAEYLLGAGDRTEDGYGCVGDVATASQQFPGSPGVKEVPKLGFRDPGPDGVWGAWTNPRELGPGQIMPPDGSVASRRNTPFLPSPPAGTVSLQANNDLLPGRVYGPYLDLAEARNIGRINSDGSIALPGDDSYDTSRPPVIVDYWGRPLRYYRRVHAINDPGTTLKAPTLADVVILRPWIFDSGDDTLALADANPNVNSPLPGGGTVPGDNASSRRLLGADFAILSEGPDRRSNRFIRADAQEYNKDNIVEVGQ
jgi:type II secretory pathway pseudopilin PulG